MGKELMEYFVVQLPDLLDQRIIANSLPYISPEQQAKVESFRHIGDAFRCLTGDLLIRVIICEKFKVSNQELKFERNSYGKPFWREHPDFQFSVSHSGQLVVCATHDKEIGIDVEQVKAVDIDFVTTCLSEREMIGALQKEGYDLYDYFCDLWIAKESYVKALGKGMFKSFDSFSVKLCSNDTITILDRHEEIASNFLCKRYRVSQNYRVALCAACSSYDEFPDFPTHLSFHSIYNRFDVRAEYP
ncbi:4'-phosphopantetheinyl transferase family protein [Sulfobacillus thermosulfidooxidans]|nr:4'-phosphopantetheinyl transferase superfamily protein [Sulfobacillus thermosulfidooxidans]